MFIPQVNIWYFKIRLLREFLTATETTRQKLVEDLVTYAIDPTIRMRRLRMLRQLADFESQIIDKIYKLETDNIRDLVDGMHDIGPDLYTIVDINA